MGDIITLRGAPIDLFSDTGHAFVVDCTRAGEGTSPTKSLRKNMSCRPWTGKISRRIRSSAAPF